MNFVRRKSIPIALCLASVSGLSPVIVAAEDGPAEAATTTRTQSTPADKNTDTKLSPDAIAQLKAQIAAQQKEIELLRQTLETQQKMLDRSLNASASDNTPVQPADANATGGNAAPAFPKLGEVASRTPVIPGSSSSGAAAATAALQKPNNAPTSTSPLSFGIGNSRFTPFGFIDVTNVIRSTNTGGAIGTGFGGIPFNNAVQGHLSEDRLSLQNSRLGLRIDSEYKGTQVVGYLETDFLGAGTPANLNTTSNSAALRLRLFFVDLRKDKWEFLAGQSWSMMTPNRKGISPYPGDIFYSQDFDTNYQLGLTWGRLPGFRAVYHANDNVTWGIAAEEPDQFTGAAVTLPAALAATAFTSEFDNNSQSPSAPNVMPDIISKLAFDTDVNKKHMHAEIRGVLRTFRTYNPLTNQHYTKIGGGGAAGFNLELAPGFRLIADGYYSDGGGRYIIGAGPDLIPKINGDMSLVHSMSTVDGFEYALKGKKGEGKESLFYAYYGGAYFQKDYGIDTTGKTPVFYGYGFPGSANSANRAINEYTIGLNQTFWKNPNYGDIRLFTQYSYLDRFPWWNAATATQTNAHTNMIWINLRYDLP